MFIAALKGEVKNGVDRGQIGLHLISAAERGEYRICTSTWTIAEVFKIKRDSPNTSLSSQEILGALESPYIVLVDVDRTNAIKAHELARDLKLKPADAVHLACALRAECDVLLSWDGHFNNLTGLPSIICEEPQALGQLTLPGP